MIYEMPACVAAGWILGAGFSLPDCEGPDVAGLAAMLDATTVDVIASGGVGRLDDLRTLAALESADGRRLSGVIVGTALYEGRFTVGEAAAASAGGGG